MPDALLLLLAHTTCSDTIDASVVHSTQPSKHINARDHPPRPPSCEQVSIHSGAHLGLALAKRDRASLSPEG